MSNSSINLPPEVRDTLIQFEGQYLTAMQTRPPSWLDPMFVETARLGPKSLKARFPIPIQAAEYRHSIGPTEYRRLSQKFVDVDYDYWSDGVAELVDVLRSNAFTGWGSTAAAWVIALQTMKQKAAMRALEAGLSFESWDDEFFFSTTHPWNPASPDPANVQSNVMYSATVGAATLDAIASRFRSFKGPNGEKMGLQLSGLLYPGELTTSWENIIMPSNASSVVGSDGVDPARWRGRVWGKETPESTLPTVYYAVATNRPDIKPLLAAIKMAPGSINMSTGQVTDGDEIETEIDDMYSQLYRDTKMVAMKKTARYAAKVGNHLAIIRCNTAASD